MYTNKISAWVLRYMVLLAAVLLFSSAHAGDNCKSERENGLNKRGVNCNAVEAFTELQNRADSTYANARYSEAFELYYRLATVGDAFSQYKISLMYSKGRGTQKNISMAYAWSVLAAESSKENLVDYHNKLKNSLTSSELHAAYPLVEEYLRKWGVAAQANKTYLFIRRFITSRMGPGSDGDKNHRIKVRSCYENSVVSYSDECLLMGAAGIPRLDILATAYAAGYDPHAIVYLRNFQSSLRKIIEEGKQNGVVSLRDLELVD